MAARSYGQYSGIVTALEMVGERWALLIVRDLLGGARRFSDLRAGLPRIPTNILSARLKELQQTGVVRRVPLAHGLVYDLTDAGRELEGIVIALERWGMTGMTAPVEGDVLTVDALSVAFRAAFRADAAEGTPPTVYEVRVGEAALTLRVDGATLSATRESAIPGSAVSADLVFSCGPRVYDMIAGELTPRQAISQGEVHLLHGNKALLDRFAQTFHVARTPVAPPAVAAG